MNKRLSGVRAGTIAGLVLLAGAPVAMAQNALGDGRGLEKDLRSYGQGQAPVGNAPRANFRQEIEARNAAITGNAANGRSLMIDRPYFEGSEFHGNLAGDSIFRFNRDSYASTAPYRGMQYTNTFSNGLWRPSAPLVTRLDNYGLSGALPRSSNKVATQAETSTHRRQNAADMPGEPLLNPAEATMNGKVNGPAVTSPVGTLRSAGAYTATQELSPSIVGYEQVEGGVSRMTASSLLGLRPVAKTRPTERQAAETLPTTSAAEAMGLDASPEKPKLSASNSSFRTSYDDLRDRLTASLRQQPQTAPSEDPNLLPAGQKPEKKPGDINAPGAKSDKPAEPSWEDRMKTLRDRLDKSKGKKAKPGEGGTSDQIKVQPKTPKTPDAEKPEDTKPAAADTDKNAKKKYAMAGLDDETLEIIRKAGGEAKTYTSGNAGSLYEVHLKAGEEELAKGRYFDAEERFSRALSLKPGDATVQAARLNAQIGAGLYVSAATNLRQMFQQHPEVIGVRYTGTTMPKADRLKSAIDELRDTIAKAKKEGIPPQDETALLLAYLGYQTNDAAAIKDGLAALRESKDGAGDPLVAVLEGVWGTKEQK